MVINALRQKKILVTGGAGILLAQILLSFYYQMIYLLGV